MSQTPRKSTPPAKRNIRIADVAAQAGVSPRAVSKVLFPETGNNTRVGKAAAARIQEIAARLGYIPNSSARQLAGEKTRLIGVIIDSSAPKVTYNILNFLEQKAANKGFRILIGRMHNEISATRESIDDHRSRGVEGSIVLAHDYHWMKEEIETLFQPINNAIFIGEPILRSGDWVGADIAKGVEMIVSHLISTGRKRIAILLPSINFASVQARIDGFKAALRKHKLRLKENPIYRYSDESHVISGALIHNTLDQLLHGHPDIDAIIASNDLIALYINQYCLGRQICIPDQLAVVGFDNLPITEAAYPTLTSVDQREEDVAELAIELLMNRIAHPGHERQISKIPPKLVLRNSTLPKAT